MGNTYRHFVCLVIRGRSLKLQILPLLAVSQGVPLTAGEASWEHHTHPTLSYLIRGVDLPIFSRLAPSHHRLTELVWCGASNGLPGTLPSTTAAALCSLTRLVILDLRDHDVQVGRWQRSRAACARVCDSGGGVGRCFLLFKILAGTLSSRPCLSICGHHRVRSPGDRWLHCRRMESPVSRLGQCSHLSPGGRPLPRMTVEMEALHERWQGDSPSVQDTLVHCTSS